MKGETSNNEDKNINVANFKSVKAIASFLIVFDIRFFHVCNTLNSNTQIKPLVLIWMRF